MGVEFDPREILRSKRDGGELSREEIDAFLEGYLSGEVSDAQATALLAALFHRGMGERELADWTEGMLATGATLRWDLERPVVDKHSTGGVGDKTSLVLAPALAAAGMAVPMLSGRGLGHTGGTLDKLEALDGLTTELSPGRLQAIVREVGCVIAAQTSQLVPADRALYALRDATGLVESLPLIASSILSKKRAEGLDALVLDVKFASGAFFPDPDRGRELARVMLRLARGGGIAASALLTSMESPLGEAVGHALELAECFEVMRAGGPADLRRLIVELGASLCCSCGLSPDLEAGRARIAGTLDDGRALEVFERMARAQGARSLELPRAPELELWLSPASGVLDIVDCRAIGLAAKALSGGAEETSIDSAAGLRWMRRSGEQVRAGDLIAEIHHSGRGLDEARRLLEGSIAFDTGRSPAPLVLERLE